MFLIVFAIFVTLTCIFFSRLISHPVAVGFFVVDYDTKNGKLVFNRTVRLKESKEKGGA